MQLLKRSYCIAIFALISAFCGCVNHTALRNDYAGYSDVYGAANNKQLLLNLAREEHEEPISFVQLASISSQYQFMAQGQASSSTFSSSSAAAPRIAPGIGSFLQRILTLGGTLSGSFTETPIFQFVPLTGTNLTMALLSPVSDRTFYAFYDQGWRADWLARMMLQSVVRTNETGLEVLVNDPTSPTYPEFLEFCDSLYDAQKYNWINLRTSEVGINIYSGRTAKLSDVVNAVNAGLKVTQDDPIARQVNNSLSAATTNIVSTVTNEVLSTNAQMFASLVCTNLSAQADLVNAVKATNAQIIATLVGTNLLAAKTNIVNAVDFELAKASNGPETIVTKTSQNLSLVKTNIGLSEESILISKLAYFDWYKINLCANLASSLTNSDAKAESDQIRAYFTSSNYINNLGVVDYCEVSNSVGKSEGLKAPTTSAKCFCLSDVTNSEFWKYAQWLGANPTATSLLSRYETYSPCVYTNAVNQTNIAHLLGKDIGWLIPANQNQPSNPFFQTLFKYVFRKGANRLFHGRAPNQILPNDQGSPNLFDTAVREQRNISTDALNAAYDEARSNLVLLTARFYVTNLESRYSNTEQRAWLIANNSFYQKSKKILAYHRAKGLAEAIPGITFKLRTFEAILYNVANEQRNFEFQATNRNIFKSEYIEYTNSSFGTIATVTRSDGSQFSVRPILVIRYDHWWQRAALTKVAEVTYNDTMYTIGDLEGKKESKDPERVLIFRNQPNPYPNRQVFTILSYLFLESGINNQNFPVQQLIQVQ